MTFFVEFSKFLIYGINFVVLYASEGLVERRSGELNFAPNHCFSFVPAKLQLWQRIIECEIQYLFPISLFFEVVVIFKKKFELSRL